MATPSTQPWRPRFPCSSVGDHYGYQVVGNTGGNPADPADQRQRVEFSDSSLLLRSEPCGFLNGQTLAIYANLGTTQFEVQCTSATGLTCPVTPSTSDSGTATTQGNTFPQSNVTLQVASAAGFTTSSPACIFDNNESPPAGLTWDCSP